jgi:hypothetical protein
MADQARIPRYTKLEKPEFKSTIPPHLVDKLSPQEKYLVETLSRMEAQNEWIIKVALDENRANIETDLRVQEIQDWKSMVSSKWAVVAAFLLICAPVVVEKILARILKP